MRHNVFAGKNRTWGLSLDILSEDELEDLHLGTLELLEQTGIFVENDEALDLFEGGGAVVNRETKMVKIPPYLVDECIQSAPAKVVLYGAIPNMTWYWTAHGSTSLISAKASSWLIPIPARSGNRCKKTLKMRPG